MHVNEIIARNTAASSARDALHAETLTDLLDRLRKDGRLDIGAIEVVEVGNGTTVLFLAGDNEAGLAISLTTRADGDEELTLRDSALQDCTSKWGFRLEDAVEKHIDAVVDAEASSIVERVLDGKDSESMAACGWTRGTVEEFAELWLACCAGDLLGEGRLHAKELHAAVERKFRAAYDSDLYDTYEEATVPA